MSIPNPYIVVHQLEEALADYAGSKYCVCVESGSAGILLSLLWQREMTGPLGTVRCPKRTYPSIPCSIILMGGKVLFTDEEWEGTYQLKPYPIVDGALRFRRGMYQKGTLHMISMHVKKHIPVGRGGAILTDDQDAYEWLKRARFDGRGPMPLQEDNFTQLGLNAYMQPTDAARGLQLLQALGNRELEDLKVEDQKYPDLSVFPVYQENGRFMKLRRMKMTDADLMLEFKNYPETRQFAITSHDEIKKEDHLKWLQEHLYQFRVIDGQYHNNLGAVRVDNDEVSIWVNRRYWGLGVATNIIQRVSKKGMRAKIVDGNVASMKAFVKAGFVPVEHVDTYYILEKP